MGFFISTFKPIIINYELNSFLEAKRQSGQLFINLFSFILQHANILSSGLSGTNKTCGFI